jgi:hypothetical protein
MNSIAHTWGTQPEERRLAFPCSEIITDAADAIYRGVTIQAEPQTVFRWLCQMRVAPYSYDWLDNLGRRSPRRLTPGLDQLAAGQTMMRDFELIGFAWGEQLTLRLKPGSLIRKVCGDGILGWLARRLIPWGDLVMMRRQLLNFKQLAERTCELTSDSIR